MTVRCKFTCRSVTKQVGWDRNKHPFLWNAEFVAVTSGSTENEKFWAATPNGKLEVGCIQADAFEVGRDYYLDISLAS